MSRSTVDRGAAIPGIDAEEGFEQRSSQLGHRGPDGHLQAGHALGSGPSAHLLDSQAGQAGYFGSEALLERREEPPFSGSVPASSSWSPPSGETGRASQMASFTSTICSTWDTKVL